MMFTFDFNSKSLTKLKKLVQKVVKFWIEKRDKRDSEVLACQRALFQFYYQYQECIHGQIIMEETTMVMITILFTIIIYKKNRLFKTHEFY